MWAVQPQGTKWRAIKEDDWRIFDKSPRITPIIWAFPFKAVISIAGISGLSTTSRSKTGEFWQMRHWFYEILPKKERYPRNASKAFVDKEATGCCRRFVINYTSPALKQTFRDANYFFVFTCMFKKMCSFTSTLTSRPPSASKCFIDHGAVTWIDAVGDVALFDQSAKNTGQIQFCSSRIVP